MCGCGSRRKRKAKAKTASADSKTVIACDAVATGATDDNGTEVDLTMIPVIAVPPLPAEFQLTWRSSINSIQHGPKNDEAGRLKTKSQGKNKRTRQKKKQPPRSSI
jgi:phosphoribosylcarboxyaminoimidazole (NCAIR) mutase